jgi:hypothetical protein
MATAGITVATSAPSLTECELMSIDTVIPMTTYAAIAM